MSNLPVQAPDAEGDVPLGGDPIFHPLVPLLAHRQAGPRVFVKGEGIHLVDRDGNRFIDGLSGLWNVNIGHGDTRVQDAVTRQMAELEYAPSFFGYSSLPAEALGRELRGSARGGPWKVFFTNGGSEAVETAIKLARYVQSIRGFPGRYKIVGRFRGYHGSTLATTAATGLPAYWARVGPLPEGFVHVPPPYCYRCPWDTEPSSCSLACANAIEAKILEEGPETVAAVIAEPVMATGGVIPSPDGYLQELREICDRHGVLYVDDEVVCGFGRTGEYYGVDHWDVVPDMLTLAKGISSAYLPMGGVLLKDSLYAELEAFAESEGDFAVFHGFTTGAHPTACAASLANLAVVRDDDLVARAASRGAYLRTKLAALEPLPIVGDVRGLGLIAAVELVRDKGTREGFDPALRVGQRVVHEAFERGLLCRAVGGSDSIALAPPLIVSEDDLDVIVDTLEASIAVIARELDEGSET
jgi:adenosylmethionine-8-amino-7-oxononanoate aminotransferase